MGSCWLKCPWGSSESWKIINKLFILPEKSKLVCNWSWQRCSQIVEHRVANINNNITRKQPICSHKHYFSIYRVHLHQKQWRCCIVYVQCWIWRKSQCLVNLFEEKYSSKFTNVINYLSSTKILILSWWNAINIRPSRLLTICLSRLVA